MTVIGRPVQEWREIIDATYHWDDLPPELIGALTLIAGLLLVLLVIGMVLVCEMWIGNWGGSNFVGVAY